MLAEVLPVASGVASVHRDIGEGRWLQRVWHAFNVALHGQDYAALHKRACQRVDEAKEADRHVDRFCSEVRNGWSDRTKEQAAFFRGACMRLVEMAETCRRLIERKAGKRGLIALSIQELRQEVVQKHNLFWRLMYVVLDPSRIKCDGTCDVPRDARSAFEEMVRQGFWKRREEPLRKVRVHLLNPACRVLPPALPRPDWIDPEIYTVAAWTVGRDVSPDIVDKWLDRETQELYAIRMLKLRDGNPRKPQFVYGEPQFVTKSEWEEQARHHGVQRHSPAVSGPVPRDAPSAAQETDGSDNRWTDGKTHLIFPPLPPDLRGQSGAIFQSFVFTAGVGQEVALFLLDDPDFARELGSLKPFHLVAKCGAVETSAGMIAFILWSVSSANGHVVDYEQLLNPFNTETIQLVTAAGSQRRLKVVVLDSVQSRTQGFLEFDNAFGLDEFASMLAEIRRSHPPANFARTRSAFFAEFSLEELKDAA